MRRLRWSGSSRAGCKVGAAPYLSTDRVGGWRQRNPREWLVLLERAALWPGMLATQLFFIQVFAEQGNQEHVECNLRALTWIRHHRDDVRRLVEVPQDPRADSS